MNLFRVIRDRPKELAEMVMMTPWAREEYSLSYIKTGNEIEDARRYLVRLWQAFGSKTSDRTGWRNDVRGRKYSMTMTWRKVPDRILAVADRLMDAQIENQPAIDLIIRYSFSEVLIYADPPYPLSTKSKRMYAYEITDNDHIELLEVLDRHPGPVIISGYACQLYDNYLKHWHKKTTRARAELGQEREEVLWINPVAAEKLNYSLFIP